MAKISMTDRVLKLMKKQEQIRNLGIVAHVDHGKTTLCDNLLAAAGIISDELAGDQTWTDYDQIEQDRGITIKSANVSLVHDVDGKDYLINLVDTPGHVDFGGDVTRALRAVDGCLVVTDAVEGVMPQTETVLRSALKERVKPVLFINKVDRFIKEMKLTPEAMQKQIIKIIAGVNEIIYTYAPEEFKEKWKVKIEDGSVGLGSAYQKWAIDFKIMKGKGIGFKEIIEKVEAGKHDELHKKIPLSDVVLGMAVHHLPNPIEAQKYRIPRLWHGDLDSPVGKSLVTCDPNGPLVGCVTKVINDPHAGVVSAVRLYSGTLHAGQELYMISGKYKRAVQQVGIYKGPFRLKADDIPAGNIISIVGMKEATSGETIASEKIEPFEAIKHVFDPVVTKAIEPSQPKDLPKLIEALRDIAREDATIKVHIDEETGEYLISGLGELHLDIWLTRLKRDWKVDANVSDPIVVYRESVKKESPEVEGKSPNKHNKFYLIVEPMAPELYKAVASGEIPEMRVKKKKDIQLIEMFQKFGLEKAEARGVVDVYQENMFINLTKGQVHLPEVIDTVVDGFRIVMDQGPLAKEKCSGLKLKLTDCTLHEDGIHRGPAQVIPAMRDGIKQAMVSGEAIILEPIQRIRIDVPQTSIAAGTSLVQGRRGKIVEMKEDRGGTVIIADIPVSNMFGFTNDLRSATEGKGFWSLIDSQFKPCPKNEQLDVIRKIRDRKGLKKVEEGYV